MRRRIRIAWGGSFEPIIMSRQALRRRLDDALAAYPAVRYVRVIRHTNRLGEVHYFATFGRGQAGQVLTLVGFTKEQARTCRA